ncbi:MAG: DUF393 domain-containing protein [Rhodospirillales bacterium]|nr:DUF393 domain-containing protein [Rhodospirillales bacterium]
MSNAQQKPVTVFYDGACPLCAREIAFYRRQDGADAVRWVDVASTDPSSVVCGLDRETALARFHVLDSDGNLVSGGAAFTRLWLELPIFRSFARVLRVQPFAWVTERGYRLFLRFRPRLQSALRARDACDG